MGAMAEFRGRRIGVERDASSRRKKAFGDEDSSARGEGGDVMGEGMKK